MDSINFEELSHISNEQIQIDIDATKQEINNLLEEQEILSRNPTENKVKLYFISGKIISRNEFISKLNSILNWRKNKLQ